MGRDKTEKDRDNQKRRRNRKEESGVKFNGEETAEKRKRIGREKVSENKDYGKITGWGNMLKRHKTCEIFTALMLIMFFSQPANAEIFVDSAETNYSPVYDGNSRSLETAVDFHIDSDGEVYFKLLAYEKNDALNEGWWVHYLVYDSELLIGDLGNKSGNNATGYVSVVGGKIYTLKAFVHMPGNLSLNQSYQCIILLCEHSGAGGGSGGTPDPNVKFTSIITLTTTYLIYGHVYDENNKPIPGIDVSIANMETGNSAVTETNNTGFYSYNLYNLGYHNSDRIMVSATYSNITGYNLTTVNIENNFSVCDIVIPASIKTENPEVDQIIWVAAGVIAAGIAIGVLFVIYWKRRHK